VRPVEREELRDDEERPIDRELLDREGERLIDREDRAGDEERPRLAPERLDEPARADEPERRLDALRGDDERGVERWIVRDDEPLDRGVPTDREAPADRELPTEREAPLDRGTVAERDVLLDPDWAGRMDRRAEPLEGLEMPERCGVAELPRWGAVEFLCGVAELLRWGVAEEPGRMTPREPLDEAGKRPMVRLPRVASLDRRSASDR
jgi:hypothetical protein